MRGGYTASPESLARARRALVHFGSYENIRRNSFHLPNGEYVYHIPKDCSCGCTPKPKINPYQKNIKNSKSFGVFVINWIRKIIKG